ncbi:MAG: alanine--tRNA ligase [Candidatus Omnitrophica bacterium CG1_02_41_171]|nr:MAG: alanine--tRNA ligase [Candidatus Omnitrophica bacterium CG1_02_41_171]
MNSNEIRKLFLDFFKEKNHRIVPGHSLIPDDPTLLFTSAGMVQFKPFWLGNGKEKVPFSRAATVQKCLRAGGKDSDLENVGKSTKHHSFFEMLGNFSFGDYFKKEAILWAWEFLLEILKLPGENLWVSVYEEDQESFKIWQKVIETRKIVFLGKKDNFWGPAGDSGPCGPCSEIYFDLGEKIGCGKKNCRPGCDCNRFLEFWNLVFPQFNQKEGKLLPLGRPGVDTGMGLERVLSIAQGKISDYETDLFAPIIEKIETITNLQYGRLKTKDTAIQIISDHIRAIVFAISDGIYPENTSRGYLIRRIIRRAARTGKSLGINHSFLYQLVKSVSKTMQEFYPDLSEKSEEIIRIIREEEEKFGELIDSGENLFAEKISSLSGRQIPGSLLFKLYDTYGLPFDLMQDLAEEKGLLVDRDGFNGLIKKQQERARKSSKFTSSKALEKDIPGGDFKKTAFVGYGQESVSTKILRSFQSRQEKDLKDILVLQKTPFYPEKGGQVGDRGWIKNEKMEFEVLDTQKDEAGDILHLGKFKKKPLFEIKGAEVIASIDKNFRKTVSSNHTATHLLQWALREILGKEVEQRGSFVGEDYLRFDFSYAPEISTEELGKIEEKVNRKILENSSVSIAEMELERAKRIGALALFDEKYEKNLRVVSIGDYSREVCGGTHLAQTGEIGLFLIKSLSSIGKGTKRIEAVTREVAYQQTKREKAIIETLILRLKTSADLLLARIEQLFKEEKEERKTKEILMNRLLDLEAKELLKKIKVIQGIKLISEEVAGFNQIYLRTLSDILRGKIDSGVILLAAKFKGNAFLVVTVTKDLIKRGFSANSIVKKLTSFLGGGGGGREDFAQGNGKNLSRLKEVLKKIEEFIEKNEEKRAG